MRQRYSPILIAFIFTLLSANAPARGDSYTFSLVPASGDISGPSGSTVGWGYSITNDSSVDWLVTSGLASDPFLNGTPDLIFEFPDLGPGVTVTVPFSPVATASCTVPPCGLYELTWDNGAPVGFVNSGNFTLSAQWWTGDPLNGGMFIMDATDSLAAYSATVAASGTVPEPSAVLLLLAGLGAVALRLRRRMSF